MPRYLWLAATVVVLDQATKYAAVGYLTRTASVAITSFLNLTLVYNTGAAFGFLSDAPGWQNSFFIAVAAIASVVIVGMLRRLPATDRMAAIALTLILGGAIGNVIDRVTHGYVIDFIDVYYRTWHWPAFNMADSAITVGAVLLVLDTLGIGARRPSK